MRLLSTNNKSSFAYFTLTQRFPEIIQSIISNNVFDEGVNKKLMCLKNSIPHGKLELLRSDSKVNEEINTEITKHNYTWDNVPFLFVENYLYHKLCEITGYKNKRTDFFAYKKNEDVINKLPQMTSVIAEFNNILELPFDESASIIVHLNLSGNMADLSHLSALKTDKIKLLIDHTDKLPNKFRQAKRIDIILDNSGEELFYDLLLTYWFLKKTNIEKINLHFKTMPYFVSDALISDYRFLIEQLTKDDKNKNFVLSIKEYVKNGKIVLCSNDFWSDGYNFNQMPESLLKEMNQSDLLIFKGDLNYRKLVEDRDWNYTTKTSDLIDYFETDVLIIRVLKSEVIVGLQKENVPSYENKEWTYNAKYGIIEFLC